MSELKIASPEQMKEMAAALARHLQAGDVLTLSGDLGAGKTTFTQGLARGLDIKKVVNSPTFTIIKEYSGRLPLYHMDVYRLREDEDLGFDEYFEGDGVTVVEWPDRIADWLPDKRLDLNIRYDGETGRRVSFRPHGAHFETVVKEFLKR